MATTKKEKAKKNTKEIKNQKNTAEVKNLQPKIPSFGKQNPFQQFAARDQFSKQGNKSYNAFHRRFGK